MDRDLPALDREIAHAAIEHVELMEKAPHRDAEHRSVWLPDSSGYTRRMPRVLVSLFLRRAALAEARRAVRPIDDPDVRRAYERLLRTAKRLTPISTADALRARDRGRR